MFEKDIYQLIRGLRAHKGTEREYIQACLRECRQEIKSPDMDQKTTALLKLVYLEMFGHDMSWASFNVLEVMSSAKYVQKRVGYLSAVQSFRPDTEVLVLAENLLKKDLGSPDKLIISLPLISIPHVVSPSMANSLLTDLLPRLSHSYPAIRKKAIMTLYRLALVYPETLRPAWPKIKERLLDENEDPSVTAAIVNVVCELGWRRPQDFLPLAPRLFELLTDGNNNWMAIKIIKLFSVLTPLEPRLVKKLLPPLTNIIRTTPAMSLLYECINGIIQGGIMEAAGGTTEGDEVARLCVNKLRAMLVVEGDPNLRYVALLAFAKITSSHADLVAQHQDVILECIDDADISIRTRALDLVVGMINANNLQTVVERLLDQLRNAGHLSVADEPGNNRTAPAGIVPMADDDEDEAQSNIASKETRSSQAPPLPDDYRSSVIERILQMCFDDTYKNMIDFEWYIGVLLELVKQCPATSPSGRYGSLPDSAVSGDQLSMSDAIGAELLNVAVRVKAVRPEAAAAAQSLLMLEHRDKLFPVGSNSGQGVLASAAFIAGEYAGMLSNPESVLLSMLDESSAKLPAAALASYLQAIPKIFASLNGNPHINWDSSRKSQTELQIARIIHFLESLVLHPNLEVQERAVEYLDLMRLASEAVSAHHDDDNDDGYQQPPLLLTQAIPALFNGMELNPVAPSALRMVPSPEDLDLDTPINPNLSMLLYQAEYDSELDMSSNDVYKFYNEKPSAFASTFRKPAADLLEPPNSNTGRSSSYQDADEEYLSHDQIERRKAERRERYKDDPYYIDSERSGSGVSTPMHTILRNANGEDVDVDAIPVMELKLDSSDTAQDPHRAIPISKSAQRKLPRKRFEITADESLTGPHDPATQSYSSSSSNRPSLSTTTATAARSAGKKSLLQLDSSGLSTLSLSDPSASGSSSRAAAKLDIEHRLAEEEEMARAMQEVERLRREMQRAQERIAFRPDLPEDGVLVKRKKKKAAQVAALDGEDAGAEQSALGLKEKTERKKKKKKKSTLPVEDTNGPTTAAADPAPPDNDDAATLAKPLKRKKKKREIAFDEP